MTDRDRGDTPGRNHTSENAQAAGERQKTFSRRALLEAGWTVPLIAAVHFPTDAYAVSVPAHQDSTGTSHSDGIVPHEDTGGHADVPGHNDVFMSHQDAQFHGDSAPHADSSHLDLSFPIHPDISIPHNDNTAHNDFPAPHNDSHQDAPAAHQDDFDHNDDSSTPHDDTGHNDSLGFGGHNDSNQHDDDAIPTHDDAPVP